MYCVIPDDEIERHFHRQAVLVCHCESDGAGAAEGRNGGKRGADLFGSSLDLELLGNPLFEWMGLMTNRYLYLRLR